MGRPGAPQAVLGGKASPSAADVKSILSSGAPPSRLRRGADLAAKALGLTALTTRTAFARR